MMKLVKSSWRTLQRFLKKLKIELPYDPVIPFLGIYWGKTLIQKDMCTREFIVVIFMLAKTWKKPKCPSTDEWIKMMWYVYTMEYSLAIKENEIMPFAVIWMNLEIIILSQVRQRQIPYITHM